MTVRCRLTKNGVVAANPKPFCSIKNPWPVRLCCDTDLSASTRQLPPSDSQKPRSVVLRAPLRRSCMHCFPQCIRPIHSAHKKEPPSYTSFVAGRNLGVRRQSAARGSGPPGPPPLTASLPARHDGSMCRVGIRHSTRASSKSPDGVSDARPHHNAPQLFRSCCSGHHSRINADGSRLPCRARLPETCPDNHV